MFLFLLADADLADQFDLGEKTNILTPKIGLDKEGGIDYEILIVTNNDCAGRPTDLDSILPESQLTVTIEVGRRKEKNF